MKNIEDYVVLDLQSGTYFGASDAVLINWSKLNEEEMDTMINGSDTERVLLADQLGEPFFN